VRQHNQFSPWSLRCASSGRSGSYRALPDIGCYLNLQIPRIKVWLHSLLLVKSQCVLLKAWFYIIVFACGNRMFCWISILVSWRTMFVNKTSCLVGSWYLVNNMFCLAITHITHLDWSWRKIFCWLNPIVCWFNPHTSVASKLPSGKLTVCYWKWP
jgi:hypothetical protein